MGKSTLLHIMGALDVPTSGKVYVRDTDVFAMSETDRAAFRNKTVGFVFQFHNLLRELTALENVMMPCLVGGMDRDEAASRAEELLAAVRLSDRADHRPGELSGGEEQRAAVARALVTKPLMVLADEPSGNLDRASSDELHDLMWGLRESSGQAFVIVTHNPDLFERADRVVALKEGLATEREGGAQR